ncbi:hypothetical protein SprV_0100242300 [Sparganum proliferum]
MKATWMHPRSRHWKQPDCILFQRRDRQNVLATKAIGDADGCTDHRQVISKTRLRLQPRRRSQVKELQDAWITLKAEELKGYADSNELRNFFASLKTAYGSPTTGTTPLLPSDGTTILAENSKTLKRWAEYFRSVQNRTSTISDAAIDRIPQVKVNDDQDLPPFLPEVIGSVHELSRRKVPESDAIPTKIYKRNGSQFVEQLITLAQEM